MPEKSANLVRAAVHASMKKMHGSNHFPPGLNSGFVLEVSGDIGATTCMLARLAQRES
jgi:hypothetical protein